MRDVYLNISFALYMMEKLDKQDVVVNQYTDLINNLNEAQSYVCEVLTPGTKHHLKQELMTRQEPQDNLIVKTVNSVSDRTLQDSRILTLNVVQQLLHNTVKLMRRRAINDFCRNYLMTLQQ